MLLHQIRGYRNNNPGNIRHGPKWNGLSTEQTDSAFCQFISPEYGIRALCKVLKTYQSKYRLRTIRAIVSRYAPTTENNTEAYISSVAKFISTDPDRAIDLSNKQLMQDMVTAIITHECGICPYSDDVIRVGVGMAL